MEHEQQAPPLPPAHLQVRVVGGYSPLFYSSGYTITRNMSSVLAAANLSLSDFESVLDFGCGCGRIARSMKVLYPSMKMFGTDIDLEAIDWLVKNYAQFGSFQANPHLPPMAYPDSHFDFLFSVSIFTHLPEEMHLEWLKELDRVVKPGGYLLLTAHGKNYHKHLNPAQLQVLLENGFYYLEGDETDGLPSFYRSTFHTEGYIRQVWGERFEFLSLHEAIIDGLQDAVLLRSRKR